MTPRGRAVAALALAGLLAAVVPSAQSGSTGGPEWFGPSGADAGWHMRLALTVTNPYGVPLLNAPVAAELDLARALLDAGWTGFDSGGSAVLTGFTLDLNSIRVVRYHDLQEFSGSGSGGRIQGEVPSLVLPGLLGRSEPGDALRPFDPASSPLVTVFFRVPGTLAPGQEAYFEVYFDSTRNGAKAPASYTGPSAGALEALHWSTAGVQLYGLVKTAPGVPNQVTIQALYPDTQVTVSRLSAGQFRTDGVSTPRGNPATLGEGESVIATLGFGESPVFRIDASAPIVAAVDPVGFIPSVDGGLAGSEFWFRTPKVGSVGGGESGVYFINAGTATAKVQVSGVPSRLYTIPPLPGAAYGGSNLECNPTAAWQRLEPDRSYHAEVIEGGPVMVQLQPRLAQQIPSVTGAPTGTRFLATALWSSSPCGSGNGQPFLAAASAESATLRAASLEDSIQVSPPGSAGNPRPTPHAIPAAPAFSEPLQLDANMARARDRPLSFEASAPMRVFAGGTVRQGLQSPVAGPLGGASAGTDFAVPGPAVVIAPYPETTLTAQVQYALGSSTVKTSLGRDGVLSFGADPELGRVLSMRVQSTRPVVAYPSDASPGFLAGVPGFLDATSGIAQYRGRLLEVRSQTGEDPLTVTVKSGETTSLPLVIANRGKGVAGSEGPLESVKLTVAGAPNGWGVSLDRSDLTLASDQEDSVRLLVQPPAGVGAGEPPATLTVTATSHDQPQVRDEITVIAFVKTSFGVGLWFLQPVTGPKTAGQNAAPGTTAVYPVYVKNLGSVDDTVLLTPSTTGAPQAAELRALDGSLVAAIQLRAGEVRRINLTVEAGDTTDALLLTTLTGQSQTAASSLDRLTALTRVRTASDLNLTTPDGLRLIRDGEEGRFKAVLTNPGGSASDLRITVLSDAPADWPRPTAFLVDPVTGLRVPFGPTANRFTLDAGTSQTLHLNVTPPAGTPAGFVVTLQLVVTPSPGTPAELTLTGVVAARHRLDIRPERDPVEARPGRLLEVPLAVRNEGNLDERLQAQVADAPAGWTLLPPEPLTLQRNATAEATLRINPGPAAAGLYPLMLRFVSEDGNGIEMALNVTVPSLVGEVGSVAGGLLRGQPGQRLEFRLPVSNTGNQPVQATLERPSGEPWLVDTANRSDLAPGANASLPAAWLVPRDAPDGRSAHRISVILTGRDGTSSRSTLDLPVEVGRANLRLENVSTVASPAGALVRAVVVNDGQRPAVDLRIGVRSPDGGKPLSEQVLGRIEPGGRADVLLAVSVKIPRGSMLGTDPGDAIVETNEDDNAVALVDQTGPDAPAPGLVLALAAFALAAAWSRRRRV
ncbi:MAG: hypothetical protein WC876_06340 [Candidatus Thermoplasmatota archaeon]|jgi:MYXO-CTERM domain-containing protein